MTPAGRQLSTSVSTCAELAQVSLLADYLFMRCIPHLDAEGRMRGSAWDVKTLAVPRRDEITLAVIPQLLEELAKARDVEGVPLIERYEVGGAWFLHFPGFHRHNAVRLRTDGKGHRPSRFPAPPTGAPPPGQHPRGGAPGARPPYVTSVRLFEEQSVQDVTSHPHAGRVAAAADATSANRAGADEKSTTSGRGAAEHNLSETRARFLATFYAGSTVGRRSSVMRQLDRVLLPEGCRGGPHGERAYATPATLARALEETLATELRNPDRAIVVLLRKLVHGRCNEVTPPGLAPPPVPSTRSSAPPARLGDVLPALPAPMPDDRDTALAWAHADAGRIRALERETDAFLDRAHPDWRNLTWLSGVRARHLEQLIIEAYRSRGVRAVAGPTTPTAAAAPPEEALCPT